jgi:hypothetical protein
VRLLDMHNGDGQPVHIVRPSPDGPIYVRRADDDSEFVLPSSPDVVSLADLAVGPARVASRGAAHEAFRLLFALPFDRRVVATYVEPTTGSFPLATTTPVDAPPRDAQAGSARRILAWSAVGLGAVGLGVGAAASIAAANVAGGSSRRDSQADVAQRNARISTLDAGAVVSFVAGGLSMATAVTLLLWPSAPRLQAGVLPSGGYVGYGSSF